MKELIKKGEDELSKEKVDWDVITELDFKLIELGVCLEEEYKEFALKYILKIING